MSLPDESPVEQYFYRSTIRSNRHRNRVSAYFVVRMRGSKVVARIEPLGLVPESIGDEQLAIQRLRRDLVAAGTWHETPSRRHARQRVTTAEVAIAQKVAPQNS